MSGAATWCRGRRVTRRRMRRTRRRDVEIADEFRHFAHQLHQPGMTAAECVRLTLVLGRSAHFVGARQAFDVGAVLGQLRQ